MYHGLLLADPEGTPVGAVTLKVLTATDDQSARS